MYNTLMVATDAPSRFVAITHLLAWATEHVERTRRPVRPRHLRERFGVSDWTARRWAPQINDAIQMYRIDQRALDDAVRRLRRVTR